MLAIVLVLLVPPGRRRLLSLPQTGEQGGAVVVTDLLDLVEELPLKKNTRQEKELYLKVSFFAKSAHVSRHVFVAGRLDVLVVGVVLELLQVPVVRAEGQPELDVGLAGDLQRGGEGVQAVQEDPPAC